MTKTRTSTPVHSLRILAAEAGALGELGEATSRRAENLGAAAR